jgi:DNA-binding PadR family transcriptional regulator
LNGYIEMQDVETRRKKRYQITPRALETYRQRMQDWQDELGRACRERKAAYAVISTGGSLEQDVIPQLIRAQVVKRL